MMYLIKIALWIIAPFLLFAAGYELKINGYELFGYFLGMLGLAGFLLLAYVLWELKDFKM